MGTEPGDGIGTVDGLDDGVQCALQVRHGHALVHHQTLDLMEHGGVGRVGLVLAEHAAGSQHAQDIHTQKQEHQPHQQAESVHPSGQGREQRRSYRIAGGKYADQPPHGGQRYVQPRRNIRQDTYDHKFTGAQGKAQSGQRQHSRR